MQGLCLQWISEFSFYLSVLPATIITISPDVFVKNYSTYRQYASIIKLIVRPDFLYPIYKSLQRPESFQFPKWIMFRKLFLLCIAVTFVIIVIAVIIITL